MKYWILTDTHFGHEMLTRNGHRGLGFETQILDNLKKVQGDVLLHLGDFCIGEDTYWHEVFMAEAKKQFKRVVLVRGNHDNKSYSWYYDHGWDFVCETMHMRFQGKEILFTHMPALAETTKLSAYHPVYMNIHGHLHGAGQYSHRAIDGYDAGFHYDCAPDTHDLMPVSLEKIVANRYGTAR